LRAIGLYRYGGPEVLQIVELPQPSPGPGEVRVRVHAATVNPTDIAMRGGAQEELLRDRDFPHVPGMELAGVVDAVGSGTDLRVGDAVLAMTSPVIPGGGAQAELVVVHADSAVRIPDGISFAQAATLPMNGLTARLALDLLALDPDQALGVTGAAGTLGRYAIQLALVDGLRVFAQAGAKDTPALVELGVHGWADRDSDWSANMRQQSDGGVHGLIDAAIIGGTAQAAIRDNGKFAAVRAFVGVPERAIVVHQVGVRAYLRHRRQLEDLVALVKSGQLTLATAHVLAPQEVANAHESLAVGGLRGRLVLDMSQI
jgi:NADPH2:quinone reductase